MLIWVPLVSNKRIQANPQILVKFCLSSSELGDSVGQKYWAELSNLIEEVANGQ